MPSINSCKHPLHTNPQMIRSLYYKLELFMGRDIYLFTKGPHHIRSPLMTLLSLNLRTKGILSVELSSGYVVFLSRVPGLNLWQSWHHLITSKNYTYLKRSDVLKSLVFKGIGITSCDITIQLAFTETEKEDSYYGLFKFTLRSYAIFDSIVTCSLILLLPLLTIL